MFTKILIANRGEIACRIIATCRQLGIRAIAVYSEADVDARHVRLADGAHYVGPAPSAESYLVIDRIVAAARAAGAEAIHPGYGFLSENDAFANACREAGIVFIGPPPEAIRAMGSKSAAKALMQDAGVSLVPGYHGQAQDADTLQNEAERIGYPVIIKASAGGGGKGMRVVYASDRFADALASCRRESAASFGDDRVLVEKYLEKPRHIEIQVFADTAGRAVSLFERDCSAQRRHQKVVEEAPAPGIDSRQRQAMGEAARTAASAVGYVGAGTVEFIVDDDGAFYFMEMNTRLQVEHPVTEKITGLDLVEWQLRIAAGRDLPLGQDEISLTGHAIEVRIYAEDPARGFLPSIGQLSHFVAPALSEHVRLDSAVDQNDRITTYYDPMIAKLIVWDDSRERAIARLLTALGEFQIVGVDHNIDFLARLIDHPAFRNGATDTGLIERDIATLVADAGIPPADVFKVAALARIERERRAHTAEDDSPWAIGDGWRLNGRQRRRLWFTAGDHSQNIDIEYTANGLTIDGEPAVMDARPGWVRRITLAGRQEDVTAVPVGDRLHVFFRGRAYRIDYRDPLTEAIDSEDSQDELTAPMPGRIVTVLQAPGDQVAKGAALLVMEAMKMEITIAAPAAGTVIRYACGEGDQVAEGTELIEFQTD